MNVKQVIVVRHDLIKGPNAVRRGKMMAQVAHASLGALLTCFNKLKCTYPSGDTTTRYEMEFGPDCVLEYWLNGTFTKIVVYVPSDKELIELNKKCEELNIPHSLITDCGQTEFHGIPTITCLGIGPYVSEEIDKITGNLPLL